MTREQREQEVLAEVRLCRGSVSMFWLDEKRGRHQALSRLENAGRVTVKVAAFPCWKVKEKKGGAE